MAQEQLFDNKALKLFQTSADTTSAGSKQPAPHLLNGEEGVPIRRFISMRKLIPVLGAVLAGIVSIIPVVGPILAAVLA